MPVTTGISMITKKKSPIRVLFFRDHGNGDSVVAPTLAGALEAGVKQGQNGGNQRALFSI
jgi:hypothetical protein